MERLSTSLENYHISALQEIADTLAIRTDHQPVRKGWLVGKLSRLIPQIARSEKFIRSLSEAERAALAVILEEEPRDGTTPRSVALPLILAGLVYTEDPSATTHLPRIQDVLLHLMQRGLVVNLTEPSGSSALRRLDVVQQLGIPPEVRSVLPTGILSPPSPQADEERLRNLPPMDILSADLRQYLRELFFTWAELRRQPARQLKSGEMGKRDRRRLAGALSLDEDTGLDYLSRLCAMLQALNLVIVDDTDITAVESSAATLFWIAKPLGKLPDLLRAYTRLATEIPNTPTQGPIFGYFDGLTLQPVSRIREQIVAMLSQVAGIGWLSVSLYHSLVTGDEPGTLALEEARLQALLGSLRWYGESYRRDIGDNLRNVEWHVTKSVLEELGALGIVDLGYATTGTEQAGRELIALRVVPLVRDYYANRPATGALSAEPWQVILQPDFQMLALGPVPLGILMNLEMFAKHEKTDDSVVTYRVTRDEAYWAFQRQETAATILTYLEEATGQPAPQNVQRSLAEWHRQYERIVVRRQVSVLQVDIPEFLQQLLDDPILGTKLHRLDDCTAWLHPQDQQSVQTRFRQLEILTAHSQGAKTDLDNSLRWHDSELGTRAIVPSIYVTGALRRFAEPHNGRWRLTEESTQNAATTGMDGLAIIAMIEEMTGERLTDHWQKQLKAWSSHYGGGRIAQVRLLHFERAGSLEELRSAEPMLHRWLHPLPDTHDLAIVEEHHDEEVQDLLTSWGVEVTAKRWW
jgi:hypothetical protein